MSLFSYVIAWTAITVGTLEAARCLMGNPQPHASLAPSCGLHQPSPDSRRLAAKRGNCLVLP